VENVVREMKNIAWGLHVFSPENQMKEKAGGAQGGFYGGKAYSIQLIFYPCMSECYYFHRI